MGAVPSIEKKDIKAEITHILYHIKDSSSYIRGILACESGEMFMRYFKAYLEKVFANELNKHKQDVPQEFLAFS